MSAAKPFSRLYVEDGASDTPFARAILARFPKARVTPVRDYRDVFNRPGQDFQRQKQSRALILARKKDRFLYRANEYVQGAANPNFRYATLLLNCVYNCAYCFLQGMYSSGNLVAFVNQEDFFAATRSAIASRADPAQPLELALSYETDLLASERILPYAREWITFARAEPELVIELRTKSANIDALADVDPHPRAVIAWTLSPPAVIDRYEQGTPPLNRRLDALARAVNRGWPVRLCFDPVLPHADWRSSYRDLIVDTFSRIPPAAVRDASVGVFRLNTEYFNRVKKNRPDTDLAYRRYDRENGVVTHPAPEREALLGFMRETLGQYLSANQIQTWT